MTHNEAASIDAHDDRRPCPACPTGYCYPDEHTCLACANGWAEREPVGAVGLRVRLGLRMGMAL